MTIETAEKIVRSMCKLMAPKPPSDAVVRNMAEAMVAGRTPAPGLHSHRCDRCETIWSHDPATISFYADDEAHRCPNCGDEQRFKWTELKEAA